MRVFKVEDLGIEKKFESALFYEVKGEEQFGDKLFLMDGKKER